MKQNFDLVFGVKNDAMAELLFRYMSDCRKHNSELGSVRVNFHTFLKKFELLWPKKPEPKQSKENALTAQEQYVKQQELANQLDRLAFSILDQDGDNILSIMDLVWICSNFGTDTVLGEGMNIILEKYMNQNVRSKNAKTK